MSAPEHEHSARIDLAAQWLVETLPEHQPRPLVPSLRSMFGLTAMEACTAIREANKRRAAQ